MSNQAKFVKTSDGNIGAFYNGEAYYITPDSIHYKAVCEAIANNDYEQFNALRTGEDMLNIFCEGHIDFKYGSPRWQGVPMPDLFADRVISLVKSGQEFEPMLNMLANLSENPEDHSIAALVYFLGNKNLPITKDGCFLGYKAVRSNFKDIHSGTIDNSVGTAPFVDREEVDPDSDVECSYGLHVGALDYVCGYGSICLSSYDHRDSCGNKIVIVKVNPKDVVTVPSDHSFQKLRCCRYEVISLYTGVLTDAVYDDAKVFKNSTDGMIVERPKNWIENLKSRFANITKLVKERRSKYNG